MRGKVFVWFWLFCSAGITPAYAGKSVFVSFFVCVCWDHPRICGEKVHRAEPRGLHRGSPPHMRGKDLFTGNRLPPVRITPAYAGKSNYQNDNSKISWDHPRICGEKTKKIP